MISFAYNWPQSILLPDLAAPPILSSAQIVDVSLTAGDETVFKTSLFNASGTGIDYVDIQGPIRAWFTRKGKSVANITLTATEHNEDGTDSVIISTSVVLSYLRFISQDMLPLDPYLLVHSVYSVSPAKTFMIPILGSSETEAGNVFATYRDSSGETSSQQIRLIPRPITGSVGYENICLSKIESDLRLEHADLDIELLSVAAECGQSTISLFRRPTSPHMTFYARNNFGAWQLFELPGTCTVKTTRDSSLVVVRRQVREVDNVPLYEYIVKTAPLSRVEADAFHIFCASPDIRIAIPELEPEASPKLIITDFSCEDSDADDADNSFSFTWRYDSEFPLVDVSRRYAGIFTDPFKYQFM